MSNSSSYLEALCRGRRSLRRKTRDNEMDSPFNDTYRVAQKERHEHIDAVRRVQLKRAYMCEIAAQYRERLLLLDPKYFEKRRHY